MADTIDRQALIDSLLIADVREVQQFCYPCKKILDAIKAQPSAQPVIRCKECKHQVKEWRTDKRLKDNGYMVCGCDVVGDACGYWALLGQDDDYCSMAERKTDEKENI